MGIDKTRQQSSTFINSYFDSKLLNCVFQLYSDVKLIVCSLHKTKIMVINIISYYIYIYIIVYTCNNLNKLLIT